MQLVFTPTTRTWDAITAFGEQHLPKSLGLKWNAEVKRWTTGDALLAFKMREYADEPTQVLLDAAKEKAAAAAEASKLAAAAAVVASRATDADIETPCKEGRAFLGYQKAGIAFALGRRNTLIGDDMGLGKTAQAIGVLNADPALKKILIVCPASLARNWQREIGMFGTRDLTVGVGNMKAIPATDIVISTYDAFSRATAASDAIHAITWDCMILDEAHYLKNKDSKRTQAILGGKDCSPVRVNGRKLFLTGTPITNRPVELWPLVHALAPGEFPDFMHYARRYCAARKERFGWDMSGASNLDELQDKLRATIMVRRLKSDVLTELPAKRRQVIELPAVSQEAKAALKAEAAAEESTSAEIARLKAIVAQMRKTSAASSDPAAYKAALSALGAARSVAFTEMSKVRRETAVAKAPMVAEHVREAVEAGGKVIVFAHHIAVVDILMAAFRDLGVVSITGSTPTDKRQGIVDRFQTDEGIRVFVGNMQAAGTGWTLTAAAHVVFAELDWVPGNLSQAEDRAHRLGQKNSVLVQHLVLEGSLDAKMAITVLEKQEVIDAAMDVLETAEDREARIAAVQAQIDAASDEAVEAAEIQMIERAERAAEEEIRREARDAARTEGFRLRAEEWKAEQARRTDGRRERIEDSIARAAAALAAAEPPTPEATTAISGCLRLLADADLDRATEANGIGFSKVDSYHGHELADREPMTPAEALVGRDLVRRYRRQLPADLVAAALDVEVRASWADAVLATSDTPPEVLWTVERTIPAEPATAAAPQEEVSVITVTEILDTPAAVVAELPKRKAGRPSKAATGGVALSQIERNRRWRENRAALDMPEAVAARLRALRDARGITTEQLVSLALDALEAADALRMAA